MKAALAYSFGVESIWIRQQLCMEGIRPLLIICKGRKDRTPQRVDVMLKKVQYGSYSSVQEEYIILRREFNENWSIQEDFRPHRFKCAPSALPLPHIIPAYTNTIIDWAKQQQPTRPFDVLYLGRTLQDMKFKMNESELSYSPPEEASGFKLKFPLWHWSRNDKVLLPPLELKC
jgi:hypothetical protein